MDQLVKIHQHYRGNHLKISKLVKFESNACWNLYVTKIHHSAKSQNFADSCLLGGGEFVWKGLFIKLHVLLVNWKKVLDMHVLSFGLLVHQMELMCGTYDLTRSNWIHM